jgi:polyphosphate kinase
MNSLTDKVLIQKLYEASRIGVKVDVIVRGTCCLKPGIPNVSENIRVISVVGRYLEHSRIFYFHHNGKNNVFLSSADWMTRNMEKRVEISFPIVEESMKQRIIKILELILSDNVKAREQDNNGEYHYVIRKENDPEIDCQTEIFSMAYHISEDEE